jgi:hypothetical protein
MAYRDLIGEILAPAIRRLRDREREKSPRREALSRALAEGAVPTPTPDVGAANGFPPSE